MWFFIFLACTIVVMLLPILPAVIELIARTDVAPLRVIQEYDTDITHFAYGFKNYLEKNFGSFFAAARTSEFAFQEGVLRDGTNFQVVQTGGAPSFAHKEITKSNTNKLILSFSPLELPERMLFETEVYSHASIKTGAFSHFRALLAEEAIELGERCSIMRWVHSGTNLSIGSGSTVFGRASALQSITVGDNTHFERMNAPKIVFGHQLSVPAFNTGGLVEILNLPNVKDVYERRWVIHGNVEVPEQSLFNGDLISMKNMEIGNGTHITGSLKSNKDMHIGSGVRIDGAVFSTGNLYIESGCQIAGPVVAERVLMVERGTTIGSPLVLTTVSAPKIIVGTGVTMHGTIWADESAMVSLPIKGKHAA